MSNQVIDSSPGCLYDKEIWPRMAILRAHLFPPTLKSTAECPKDHSDVQMGLNIDHCGTFSLPASPLKDQNEFNREKVVEQIVHHAQGNFLWAILTAALLKKEQTHAAFMKALHEMPKTIHDLIRKLVGTFDGQKPETKLLIQWLLVVKRPLTLAKVNCLYQVDMRKKVLRDRRTDVREDVSRACGLLVNIQHSVVAYRHNAIRAYLRKMMAEKTSILLWLDAQEDLTMRLLIYCKLSLTKPFQPVFEVPGTFDVEEIFRTHALLEYSARYWMLHFKDSSLHPSADSLRVLQELKAIFPSSTELAVLEWECWDYQTSVSEALIWHNLALRIRQAIFTKKHESVLQTLITCGSFHKRLNTKEAGTCFYHASRIGQELMQKYNAVTISCTTAFLALRRRSPSPHVLKL